MCVTAIRHAEQGTIANEFVWAMAPGPHPIHPELGELSPATLMIVRGPHRLESLCHQDLVGSAHPKGESRTPPELFFQ